MPINSCTSLYFPQHDIFILWCSGFLECLEIGPTWRQCGSKKGGYVKGSDLSGAATILNTDDSIAFGHHKPRSIFTEPCSGTSNFLKFDKWLAIAEWRSFPDGEHFWFSRLSNKKNNMDKELVTQA